MLFGLGVTFCILFCKLELYDQKFKHESPGCTYLILLKVSADESYLLNAFAGNSYLGKWEPHDG